MWRDIPQEDIQGLFDSMPRCIERLIAAHGGFTPYLNHMLTDHVQFCTCHLYVNKYVEGVCLYIDYFCTILHFLSVSYKTTMICGICLFVSIHIELKYAENEYYCL